MFRLLPFLILPLTFVLSGTLFSDEKDKEKDDHQTLQDCFDIESIECVFLTPLRNDDTIGGLVQPGVILPNLPIEIVGKLKIKAKPKKGVDIDRKKPLLLKLELVCEPFTFYWSDEIKSMIREKQRFDWELWELSQNVKGDPDSVSKVDPAFGLKKGVISKWTRKVKLELEFSPDAIKSDEDIERRFSVLFAPDQPFMDGAIYKVTIQEPASVQIKECAVFSTNRPKSEKYREVNEFFDKVLKWLKS